MGMQGYISYLAFHKPELESHLKRDKTSTATWNFLDPLFAEKAEHATRTDYLFSIPSTVSPRNPPSIIRFSAANRYILLCLELCSKSRRGNNVNQTRQMDSATHTLSPSTVEVTSIFDGPCHDGPKPEYDTGDCNVPLSLVRQ